jgi:hypothetical protein
MKTRLIKLFFGIVMLAIPLTANAQASPKPQGSPENNQAQSAKRTFNHNETIEEKYDKFKDRTSISLNMQLIGVKLDGLAILVTDGYEGNKPMPSKNASEKLPLTFLGVGDERKYKLFHSLIILADDERIRLGDAAYLDLPIRTKYVETMIFAVPYDTFRKIINAKKVEAQLGDTEFTFTEQHLEALRDFYSRIVP